VSSIPTAVLAWVAAGTVTGGCAERALAEPAPCDPRPTAVDLALDVEPADGPAVELHAARARLEPGFPGRLAGEFDDASFSVKESPAPAAGEAPTSFSVRARRMRYDARGNHASFSGDVQVTMEGLHLRCDTLEVTYHRPEEYVDFVATGSVRVERPSMTATAGKAQFDGAGRALTLTESPRVVGDAGTLEGARIVLDVDAETVTVEEVRGTFRIRTP